MNGDDTVAEVVDLSILLDPADRTALAAASLDPAAHTCLHLDVAQTGMGRANNGQEMIQIVALVPVGLFADPVSRLVAPSGAVQATPLGKAIALPPALKVVIRTDALTPEAKTLFGKIARAKLAWTPGLPTDGYLAHSHEAPSDEESPL